MRISCCDGIYLFRPLSVLLHRRCAGMLSLFFCYLHMLAGILQCLGKAQSDGVGKLWLRWCCSSELEP